LIAERAERREKRRLIEARFPHRLHHHARRSAQRLPAASTAGDIAGVVGGDPARVVASLASKQRGRSRRQRLSASVAD
jgi:hypothetical protein